MSVGFLAMANTVQILNKSQSMNILLDSWPGWSLDFFEMALTIGREKRRIIINYRLSGWCG
jgi:hypothetical protein